MTDGVNADGQGNRCVIFVPFMTAFGGVERLALNLSRFLRCRGISHCILTFCNDVDLEKFADWPIDVVVLAGPRHSLSEAYRLRQWMANKSNRNSACEILAFDLKGAFYSAFIASPYSVHLTDPPSLLNRDISKNAPSLGSLKNASQISLASIKALARAQLVHLINRVGIRKATKVITMTQRIADELEDIYGIFPLIVRPGIDKSTSQIRSREHDSPVRFLTISRLVTTKRIEWILHALGTLESTVWTGAVDWQLHIVGDGPDRQRIADEAARLGIAHRCFFAGTIPDTELNSAYNQATIFLMPAAQGWGLPALEALARGVPTVLHADSGVSEILGQTDWAVISRASDGEGFAPAVQVMVHRLRNGFLTSAALPEIPDEQDWALQISNACGWFGGSQTLQ